MFFSHRRILSLPVSPGSLSFQSSRKGTPTYSPFPHLFIVANQIFNGGPLNFGNVQVLYPDDPELSVVQYISSKFDSQYFYPLILLPLTVKQYDFLANFNDKIISKGKEILSTAGEIYLIGYRAADDVIRDMFKEVKSEADNIVCRSVPDQVYLTGS